MRLHQVIAIESKVKKQDYSDLSTAHKELQKSDLFNGLNRTYKPINDADVVYPAESKIVQKDARDILAAVKTQLSEWFNVTAQKDIGNCSARVDLVVDGVTFGKEIPVSYLLFLEKKLVDIRTLISKLPILDATKEWQWDPSNNRYNTAVKKTLKTKKVLKPFVKAEATKEHPAQVDSYSVDEPEGYWENIDLSKSFSVADVKKMLDKVDKLVLVVKMAREQANQVEVEKSDVGSKVMEYILG